MKLDTQKVEFLLRKLLPIYLIFTYITTLVIIFEAYFRHESYMIGDWLINYQGGFIRRGFAGEILYTLSQLTHINPGIYVILLQSFFYAIFFYFFYILLQAQKFLLPYAMLIFSPFTFSFHINHMPATGRKEVVYLAIFAFLVWSSKIMDKRKFKYIFNIILLLYPLLILTHEMLSIYLPLLIIIYFAKIHLDKKEIVKIFILIIPSFVSLYLSIAYSSTSNVGEIFNSLSKIGYPIKNGAISYLDKNISYALNFTIQTIKSMNYFYSYSMCIALSLISYFPIYRKLRYIYINRILFILFIITIIGSVALFFVAIDWGRFIYIILMSLFLLSFMDDKNIKIPKYINLNGALFVIFMILFFAYTQMWFIPLCCRQTIFAENLKDLNIIHYIAPYARLIRNFSKY